MLVLNFKKKKNDTAFTPNLTVILHFGEASLAPKENVQSKDVSAASSNKGFINPVHGLMCSLCPYIFLLRVKC